MKKLRGTITVFLSFVLALVMGLFFTMNEVLRYFCLERQTERGAELSLESTFADFSSPLWEEYGILGLDLGYGEDAVDKEKYELRLESYMNLNGNSDGTHMFQAYAGPAVLSSYRLLTDDGCAGLVREAALYMKENFGSEIVNSIKDQSSISDAGEASPIEPDEATAGRIREMGNPLETVSRVDPGLILGSVLPAGTQVSGKTLASSDIPSRRRRAAGNTSSVRPDFMESLLYKIWLKTKFQNYRKNLSHQGMDYELEYILCGMKSDRENLRDTANRLVLEREGANIASIHADGVKVGEAETLATVIGALTLTPELISVYTEAILALWAYAESLMDVRRLLAGGKVSLIKSAAEWTSQLYELPFITFDSSRMARDCPMGLAYEDYLMTMIMIEGVDSSAYKACDIMENEVRLKEGYGNFRMDHLMYEAETDMKYEARPLFLSFVLIFTGDVHTYEFPYRKKYSYIG